ncbi:MAG: Coenzyme F420 hydrogenase/dehydrogenase, beta subunit C-terminal domain [Oscillospiraceae bacterium]|nr:Coenzyme F420 hydrogenase/dehydrogenase, beta subunit C-terminal domain [Oscillospiraceae bacterium]
MKNISVTVEKGLCISCGVCRGICPKNCISFRREQGMYLASADSSECTECGLCQAVCPGFTHVYEPCGGAAETVSGSAQKCFNAWSKDGHLRHISASGGVISTIVRVLLDSGEYDGAFCLDTYDYSAQLKTRLYSAKDIEEGWGTSNAPKSRYLPVSHENAVMYMRENRAARLIFVGTSCAIRALRAAVSKLRLEPEQYLFIGLFCDKVFNYNVWSYFEDKYLNGAPLKAVHFKNKESGGWPGDMKFYPNDGEPFYVPLSDRARAKAYFMPERCLYCVDKLNVTADISVGDNYTGIDESELGSNSVIIRTDKGMGAWASAAEKLERRAVSFEDISRAQAIDLRLKNMYFGDLRTDCDDLNCGVPREKNAADFESEWKTSIKRLRSGAVYAEKPDAVKKQIYKDNKKPCIVKRALKKIFRYAKRLLK